MMALIQVFGWVVAVIGGLFLLSVCVFVHELGHFLAARAFKFRVEEFSIGFGPAIWKRKVGFTTYKIGWIPFGGYVSLPELDPSGMEMVQGGEAPPEDLKPKAWWKRICVSVGGPLGNVVFAVLLAYIVYAMLPAGHRVAETGVTVQFVVEGSDAEEAGLRTGDVILAVGSNAVSTHAGLRTEFHLQSGGESPVAMLTVSNDVRGVHTVTVPLTRHEGEEYYTVAGIGYTTVAIADVVPGSAAESAGLQQWDLVRMANTVEVRNAAQLIEVITASEGRAVLLRVLRGTEEVDVTVTPNFNAEEARWMMGARLADVIESTPEWLKNRSPWAQIRGDTMSIKRILQSLVAPKQRGERGRVAGALSGPVGIVTMLSMSVLSGFLPLLGFLRFLNVNLAILNLLPLPVLDGGHIVFALYEGITRRKVHPKALEWMVKFFMILLLTAFVILTFRDIRLLERWFFPKKAAASQHHEPAEGK